jgi:hypothetical protein
MRGREYLIGGMAASGLLAGCVNVPTGRGSTTHRPRVTITETDGRPDLPVRPAIEVVAPEATAAAPPELRAALTNTADHAIEVGDERDIVFAFVTSQARPGLTLLPIDGDYDAVEPGCWRPADRLVVPEYYGVGSLDPGETTERRLGVWANPNGTGCLPLESSGSKRPSPEPVIAATRSRIPSGPDSEAPRSPWNPGRVQSRTGTLCSARAALTSGMPYSPK